MPAQVQQYIELFQYIDYQVLWNSLNTPVMWAVLAGSGFVLFLTYASFRKHMFKLSMEGGGMGFVMGIVLTLVIEGFLVYKYVGWERVMGLIKPEELGLRVELAKTGPVLGQSTQCPTIEEYFKNLDDQKEKEVKLTLCQEVLKSID